MGKKPNKRGILFRLIRLLLVALVIFYAGICALVFTFQRKLLYHPEIYSVAEVSQNAQAARLERWTNSTGQFIGLKRLMTNRPAMGSILMCYGNGSSAVRCADYADVIQTVAPLDFYVLEYPGYEDRAGVPTKASLISAATEAFQTLKTNQPIYLVGESLGTGVAASLAGKFPDQIAGVILLSPYDRLANIAQNMYPFLPARWLLLDDFQSADYLKNYHGRVGVVVGDRDTIVPAKFGLRLFNGYAGPKKLWEYPRSGHIELGESPETFWKAVIAFWNPEKIQPPVAKN